MAFVVLIGNLGFTIASLVLGIRLCLLARRTRQLPELLLGIGFLTGGFLGHTLGWVILRYNIKDPYLGPVLYVLRSGAALACSLLAVMAWRVFRPTAQWAKRLAFADIA